MKDDITININKDESKSEILYNNVVSSMDELNLSKDEQIQYLKSRITRMEQDNKKRNEFVLLSLKCLLSLVIGIALLVLNFYVIGSCVVVGACAYGIIRTYMLTGKYKCISMDSYEKIEAIRKVISSKLR